MQRRRSYRGSDRDVTKMYLFAFLPHGRTELSKSCQSDVCRLQQLYRVMWKPTGTGRGIYLWVSVRENSTLSFCCCDSSSSFFFFLSLLTFNFCPQSERNASGIFRELSDVLTLWNMHPATFAAVVCQVCKCCFTDEHLLETFVTSDVLYPPPITRTLYPLVYMSF